MQRYKVILQFAAADLAMAIILWVIWGWQYGLTSFLAPLLAVVVYGAFILGHGSLHSMFGLLGVVIAYVVVTAIWISGLWSWGGFGFVVAYLCGLTIPGLVFVAVVAPEVQDIDRDIGRRGATSQRPWWRSSESR